MVFSANRSKVRVLLCLESSEQKSTEAILGKALTGCVALI